MDSYEKLRQAKELLDQGIVTEDEYNELRDRLMKELSNTYTASIDNARVNVPPQQGSVNVPPQQAAFSTQPQPGAVNIPPQQRPVNAQTQQMPPFNVPPQQMPQQAAVNVPPHQRPVNAQTQQMPPFNAPPQQMPPQMPPQPGPYVMPPQVSNAPATTGMKVLSFLIPLVGLILFLVNQNTKPVEAKDEIKWAGIGFGVGVLFYVILMAITVSMF